jgi:solute carrier family 41
MREVQQLIMIIPAVLNLKGNLEMNLSARLGTAANVGELEDPVTRRSIIIGNLTLLQVQATVVSFIVACISSILMLLAPGLLPASTLPPTAAFSGSNSDVTTITSSLLLATRRPPLKYPSTGEQITPGFSTFVMVASTAMASACLSSLVLGSFMCAVVLICLRFNLDPGIPLFILPPLAQLTPPHTDNIAPPIASCLGDLITLLFIGLTSSLLIPSLHIGSFPFFPFILIILIFFAATVALMYTARNPHVRPLIGEGWVPLFGAMAISTGTGIVLEEFVSRYEGFALLAIVISGRAFLPPVPLQEIDALFFLNGRPSRECRLHPCF